MAVLRCPKTVRAAISGTSAALPWANVFHAQYTGSAPLTPADCTAIAVAFKNYYDAEITATLFNDVTATTECEVLDIDPAGLYGGATAGTTAGTRTPNQGDPVATSLISWKGSEAYKGGHGRTYIPGLLEGDYDGAGNLTGSYVTLLQDAADDFLALVNGTTISGHVLTLGMCHFYRNGALLAPARFDAFSSGVAGVKIATQRRRLRR